MTEDPDAIERSSPHAADANAAPRVRTLLACDLVDSTALVERLGDAAAAGLLRRHDRVARDLIHRHGGREIDKTDGYLVLFERPVEAVAFALHYQRALREFDEGPGQSLRARVGIHVGEVVLWENSAADVAAGAKPLDLEGLAKPVVARLMTLALPGQILLSGVAFTLAQRAEKELTNGANLRWLTHGRYHFKGVPAPMLVHEVGESGHAPLQAPSSSSKAIRDVPVWRRPGVLALEAVAIIAAIAIPFALSLRSAPAIAFAERDWVVVGEMRNLTSEALLDESLETAFRISLEQSRFVNVLPDLKLRAALSRMQRGADTEIDRMVASEIALREGARAVILPTVAEVGGRVRVSAEVIDPNTQTTVYAESADGVGAASALDSIDTVTTELRARLGEALASIDKDSQPLPQVSTANIDALRAYALGRNAYLAGRFGDAMRLYRQALSLDPEFALVKVAMANVYLASGELAKAPAMVREALALPSRLSPRERLLAEALAASMDLEEDGLERWLSLTEAYPDYFPPFYNYAYFAWGRANLHSEVFAVAEKGAVAQNPAQDTIVDLLGTLELGLERYAEAEKRLKRADDLSDNDMSTTFARLYAAQRDHARAEAALAAGGGFGVAAADLQLHLLRATLAADRGRIDQALALLEAGREEAAKVGADDAAMFEIARLSLREIVEPLADLRPDLERLIDAERARLEHADTTMKPHFAMRLGFAAAIASRAGETELAARASESAVGALAGLEYPVAIQMTQLARAQRLLVAGDADAALDALDVAPPDAALLTLRALRVEALAAAGRGDEAAAAAEALARLRGRAYTEVESFRMLVPRNVVDTNLALLRAAELRLANGMKPEAEADLRAFDLAWPASQRPPGVGARFDAVRTALDAD